MKKKRSVFVCYKTLSARLLVSRLFSLPQHRVARDNRIIARSLFSRCG
jgi:hypothetical protein